MNTPCGWGVAWLCKGRLGVILGCVGHRGEGEERGKKSQAFIRFAFVCGTQINVTASYEMALRRALLGVMQGNSSMLAKDSSEENRAV